MSQRKRRGIVLLLATVCFLAPLTVTPSTALSIRCPPATGIVNADDGGWILTNTDTVQRFDSTWNSSTARSLTGARGIERGPNGSLWVLTSTDVVQLDEQFERQTNRSLNSTLTKGSTPRDIVYAGKWLVLFDNHVLTYDDNWKNGTVLSGSLDRLPDNTTGMTATPDSFAVVTRNGTIHVYDRSDTDSIKHRRSISANVTDRAVDIHRESNNTWIVLEPHTATTVTDDGERIDQQAFSFSCTESGGVNVLLTMLVFAAIGGVALFAIGLGLVATVRFVRSLRQ